MPKIKENKKERKLHPENVIKDINSIVKYIELCRKYLLDGEYIFSGKTFEIAWDLIIKIDKSINRNFFIKG